MLLYLVLVVLNFFLQKGLPRDLLQLLSQVLAGFHVRLGNILCQVFWKTDQDGHRLQPQAGTPAGGDPPPDRRFPPTPPDRTRPATPRSRPRAWPSTLPAPGTSCRSWADRAGPRPGPGGGPLAVETALPPTGPRQLSRVELLVPPAEEGRWSPPARVSTLVVTDTPAKHTHWGIQVTDGTQ